MASHRPESVRIPTQKDSASQFGDVFFPATFSSTSNDIPIRRFSGSPVAHPASRLPRTTQAASISNMEGNRQAMSPSLPSSLSSNDEPLPPSLPRYGERLLPFSVRQRSCSGPWTTIQSVKPSSLTSTKLNSSSLNTNLQAPVSDRPRRALRRKAPTIGRYDRSASQPKTSDSEIPGMTIATTDFGCMTDDHQQPYRRDKPQLIRQLNPSRVTKQDIANRTVEDSENKGPKELASLRTTTVDTRKLPPPPRPRAVSPLTGHSESPGLWSSVSTPTSLSSYSPGILHPMKASRNHRQPSPSQTRIPAFSPSLHPAIQAERVQQKTPDSRAAAKPAGSDSSLVRDEHWVSPDPARYSTSSPLHKPSMGFRSLAEEELDAETSRNVGVTGSQAADPLWKETATADSKYKVSSPPRPGREGVQQLEPQKTPVIRSNLTSLETTGHKRREFADNISTDHQPRPTGNREAGALVDSSQQDYLYITPSHVSATSTLPQGTAPNLTKDLEKERDFKKLSRKPFNLFTKKSKSGLHGVVLNQNKPNRKGPGAVTGHDRYSHSRQRPSTSSGSSRSSSGEDIARSRSDLNLGASYARRLDPAVIGDRGRDGASLARTQSEQSMSSFGLSSTSNHEKRSMSQERLDFNSTESLASSKGTSACLPSYNQHGQEGAKVQRSTMDTPARIPMDHQAFLNVKTYGSNSRATRSHHSIDSYNSSNASLPHMSIKGHTALSHEEGSKSPREEELTSNRRRKNFRWSFLRDNNSKRKDSVPSAPVQRPVGHYATLSSAPVSRSFAQYDLLDAGSDTLEDIPQHVNESSLIEDIASPLAQSTERVGSKEEHADAGLPPSPPELEDGYPRHEQSPSQALPSRGLEKASSAARNPEGIKQQSRLTSVGRIPRVVSSRERKHQPALQSFSRPFPHVPSLTATAADQPHGYNMPYGPPAGSRKEMSPRQSDTVDFRPSYPPNSPAPKLHLDFVSGPCADNEFLAFSPKKSSMLSSSSSSEGTSSNLAAITAVIPQPGSEPTEDEIWGEYDDLIEHISSKTLDPRDSNRPEKEEQSELTDGVWETLEDESNTGPKVRAYSDCQRSSTENTVVPTRASGSCPRFRHFRSPSTSGPSRGLKACDNDDHDANDTDKYRFCNTLSSVNFCQQPSSSPFPGGHKTETPGQATSDRSGDAVAAQANIRSGSLMTSRWLSFGRVLFSPAHKHVTSKKRERILVFDGLGNDDWSFYCALTYQNAEIFNLKVDPSTTRFTEPSIWQSLSNHHTILQPDLESPITLPNGYFAAVVLRFPAYCSEKAQSNVISECKRVLRSGGYLEMSLLDLDMVNMGTRTRKAVRKLKERTYMINANISLKPVSDSIQRLLGTHGFDNLRRCMVRIPVTGIIPGFSSGSSTSSDHSGSATVATTTENAQTGWSLPFGIRKDNNQVSPPRFSTDGAETSLGDLLSDPSPSPSNDESIARTVAKVGRWWYTQCYESPIFPSNSGDLRKNSIWADGKLLRECQRQGTGFRLLIAYAQKPSEVPRRTASV